MSKRKYFPKKGDKYQNLTYVGSIPPKFGTKKIRHLWQCVCGNDRLIQPDIVMSGTRISCGCKKGNRGKNTKLKNGNSSENALISRYKHSARKRNLEFSLTNKQLSFLFSGNCYYCGIPPHKELIHRHSASSFTYNGIDRVDNNKGYIIDNTVSCCKQCNYAKSNQSLEEFLQWAERIYKNKINDT